MSVSQVNQSATVQSESVVRSLPSDSSTTRTNPQPTQLDRHSQLWFSNTPSSRTIIVDRHSLATVFSYLQTKERIRVSQVSKVWYAITADPIAWSADQHVLCYFDDLTPPKPPRKFLAPPPPPRFPARYRYLIRRLDLNPAGSPYLLGNMKHMIESDHYLRTLPAKRVTIDDDYGNTPHLRVPREVDEFAESAATVLEDYPGLTELNFISSRHTERLMETFCRAFFKLPPLTDQPPQPNVRSAAGTAAAKDEPNVSTTLTAASGDSLSKTRTHLFRRVCILLPHTSSLPIIFQSPQMHQIEILSINLGSSSVEHLQAITSLQKLQVLTYRTSNKTYSGIWTILQQLPELHTLSVEGVECCTNASLPPSLTSLTLFLIHGDSFTREIFPSLSTATCPRLTHLTLHLFPLAHLDPIEQGFQVTHREAFLWRLAEHVTTLHKFTIQYQPDWSNSSKKTNPRVGWFWHEFLRCNRSALEVERLTIIGGNISLLILSRPPHPPEERLFPDPFPPIPVTPIDLSTDLPPHASCVIFTLFAPLMTATLKHLFLSDLIFDHDLLHTLNHLPPTVQLESLTLYSVWPDNRITTELSRLLFRAIGRHTHLCELNFSGQGVNRDARLTFETEINEGDGSGLQALLSCPSLTSIYWRTPPDFARSSVFSTLAQFTHLRKLQLVVFATDYDLLPQLFTSSHSPRQQVALFHYHPRRPLIEDKPSCRALAQLLRPYVTSMRSITLNGRSLAVWEQESSQVKRPRCLIQ